MGDQVSEGSVCDPQATKRDLSQIGGHPPDLVQEGILQPIGVLQIQPLSFMGEVYLQVFLGENRLRQALKALCLFENEVFLL